ncbi:MAG: hypothetical protein HC888_15820 [Candidatus Competibacteraceae bacterium]|nr:hypothetical protein [Candidatus Competibacteraceae bacterium]
MNRTRLAITALALVILAAACAAPTDKHFQNTSNALEERDQPVSSIDLELLDRANSILRDGLGLG